jgi:hypothetical protein
MITVTTPYDNFERPDKKKTKKKSKIKRFFEKVTGKKSDG